MKNLLLGACTAGLCLSVGCVQDYTYLDPSQNIGFSGSSGSNMNLTDGFLVGDFGNRRGFNGEATRLDGTSDRTYQNTSVNVVREQNGVGAGMVILAVSGATLDDLPAGEHRFSNQGDLSEEIYVNVCGGPDQSSFDYDQPASGTITVTDEPSGLRSVNVSTEAPRLDPTTGIEMGEVETTESSFTFQPQR